VALFGLALALSTVGAAACPDPPPAVRDLALPRFYTDAEGSKVDPEQARRHKALVEPLTAFVRHVVADTDKAVRSRSPEAAQCPLAWIAAWAEGEAWLGNMGTKQAEYQRKWDLAGIALAYLKLKRYASPAQRLSIEPWLIRFAEAAKSFQTDPARKPNNHLYWLGLGLAATALAADSPRHWDEARRIMEEAAQHVRADGTLPLELERGARALHYHAFAVTPLVVMAEIAARRGEDWYAFANGSLHRLVAVTLEGLREPARFDVLAGVPQERPPGTGAGWLTLYGQRFAERLPDHLPSVPDKHRWVGGDVRLLLDAIPALPRS
jgi:poly(beta-D-mannuronate) lyase